MAFWLRDHGDTMWQFETFAFPLSQDLWLLNLGANLRECKRLSLSFYLQPYHRNEINISNKAFLSLMKKEAVRCIFEYLKFTFWFTKFCYIFIMGFELLENGLILFAVPLCIHYKTSENFSLLHIIKMLIIIGTDLKTLSWLYFTMSIKWKRKKRITL